MSAGASSSSGPSSVESRRRGRPKVVREGGGTVAAAAVTNPITLNPRCGALDPSKAYTFFFQDENSSRSSTMSVLRRDLLLRLEDVGCKIPLFLSPDVDFYVVPKLRSQSAGSSIIDSGSSGKRPICFADESNSPPSLWPASRGQRRTGRAHSSLRTVAASRKKITRPSSRTSRRSQRMVYFAAEWNKHASGKPVGDLQTHSNSPRPSPSPNECQYQTIHDIPLSQQSQERAPSLNAAKNQGMFMLENKIVEIDERDVLVYLEIREKLHPPSEAAASKRRGQSRKTQSHMWNSKHPALVVSEYMTGHRLPALTHVFRQAEPHDRRDVPMVKMDTFATVSPFCPYTLEQDAVRKGYMQLYRSEQESLDAALSGPDRPLNLPWWVENMCKTDRTAPATNPASVDHKKNKKRISQGGHYCECCAVEFTDLETHCNSEMHLRIQEESSEKFGELDDFLFELHPTAVDEAPVVRKKKKRKKNHHVSDMEPLPVACVV